MSIRALAIETSGRIGSVALAEDGKTLAEETFPHGLQHAARIIPAIDDLCRRLRWTSADFREIYVSAGPGSFTGLRIGITLAKTLAFVTHADLVAVPSVRVLVENAPSDAENAIIVMPSAIRFSPLRSSGLPKAGPNYNPPN
jgi:tRNA threonylcarbamoyl adenosine modification protein YeaZ